MRHTFPKKQSKLGPQGKAIAAAKVLLDAIECRIDDKAAVRRLREVIGLQWTLLTCVQYLSGKEAIGAIATLSDEWVQDGKNKKDMVAAIYLAAQAVANVRSDGVMLCASHLAADLQGKDLSKWFEGKHLSKQDE